MAVPGDLVCHFPTDREQRSDFSCRGAESAPFSERISSHVLKHGTSHSHELSSILTQGFAWAPLQHEEFGQADPRPQTLSPALSQPVHLPLHSPSSQLAEHQLCSVPELRWANPISTRNAALWSNPYQHFIFRVSPGEMTMWSFEMLSFGF